MSTYKYLDFYSSVVVLPLEASRMRHYSCSTYPSYGSRRDLILKPDESLIHFSARDSEMHYRILLPLPCCYRRPVDPRWRSQVVCVQVVRLVPPPPILD